MKAEDLMREAQKYSDKITEYRRTLHKNAETGFDLKNTVAFVKEELEKMGLEPRDCGKSGVVALIEGKKTGKVFLLRADMDALPVKEEADVDFKSKNGKMHACGHDTHTSMLLGAAALLKAHQEELEGTVKLMFQPAEELLEGAKDMVESGVLENPHVDAALMIHIMAGMPFDTGTVIVSAPGVSAPAADYFQIEIQGKGCHGSMPNTGADPITAAAHILVGLQSIQAREIGMNDRAVLTVGKIQAGSAANVIPDTVTMAGTLRAFDEETREFIKKRLVEISTGTAKTFRTKAEVTFTSGCPTLVNDKDLSVSVSGYMKELLGDTKAFSVAELNERGGGSASKTSGSEDFAYVSHRVPSLMLALAGGKPEDGYGYPQHHPMVKFDENALPVGSAVYAYAAFRWLEEHK